MSPNTPCFHMAASLLQPAIRFPKALCQPLCFPVAKDRLAVQDGSGPWQPSSPAELEALGIQPQQQHYLGRLGERDCIAWTLPEEVPLPPGIKLCSLYELLLRADEATLSVAGRAMQIVGWDSDHRYCGRCGEATVSLVDTLGEAARHCPSCNLRFYPRLSPCVIVLVSRGEELLLAHGNRHPKDMYSTLAGFVEPGESVEAAVHREIHEEVGIEVHQLRYFSSQPWPFPHQLMLGFFAEYESGQLQPDPQEIADAHWWHHAQLPIVPGGYSLAGRLIEEKVQELNCR